jgi:3-hydroxypropanoate dehydrogenase
MQNQQDIAMLDSAALDQIFRAARSTHAFTAQPVTDETIREIFELLKWGPTAWNGQPGRFVFVRSPEAKARLAPAMSSSNRAKTLAAPLTAIVAYDMRFFDRLSELSPGSSAPELLARETALAETTAFRNGTLQGAYLILAARALGLAAGPMSGFNAEAINREFLTGTSWRANFLVNLGYPDRSEARPRAARVSFEESVRIV